MLQQSRPKIGLHCVCDAVAREVHGVRAHFGIVDQTADGEACRLIDEQGRAVDPETLLAGRWRAISAARSPVPTIVADTLASRSIWLGALAGDDARVIAGGSTRQAMSEAIAAFGHAVRRRCQGAILVSPASRRPPDALMTLSLLLSLLSESDRPLSEVLDAA